MIYNLPGLINDKGTTNKSPQRDEIPNQAADELHDKENRDCLLILILLSSSHQETKC